MKAEDLKRTKDEAIAAGFKHKIASLNKDIEEIRSCKVDLMSEYERMISEDLDIRSKYSAEELARQLVDQEYQLDTLIERLKTANDAFEDWKAYANYSEN